MADFSTIRDELAERLATVTLPSGDALRAGDVMADQVNTPCALVGPDNPVIDFDLTMARGADTFFVKVWVFASRTSERAGQNLLDALMSASGSSSIKAKLETGWPDGSIDFAEVKRVEDYGELTVGDVTYLGCVFAVEVVG